MPFSNGLFLRRGGRPSSRADDPAAHAPCAAMRTRIYLSARKIPPRAHSIWRTPLLDDATRRTSIALPPSEKRRQITLCNCSLNHRHSPPHLPRAHVADGVSLGSNVYTVAGPTDISRHGDRANRPRAPDMGAGTSSHRRRSTSRLRPTVLVPRRLDIPATFFPPPPPLPARLTLHSRSYPTRRPSATPRLRRAKPVTRPRRHLTPRDGEPRPAAPRIRNVGARPRSTLR